MHLQALAQNAAVAADIKLLVDPAGSTDIRDLADTATGNFVQGRQGDVTPLDLVSPNSHQILLQTIEIQTNIVNRAFLMTSGAVRDSERTTAREVEVTANELETALGGAYGRFTEELQKPIVNILLGSLELPSEIEIEPIIITGLDALSRQNDLTNIQRFVQDAALLAQVNPAQAQEIVARIDIDTYLREAVAARNVPAGLLRPEEEVQAELQRIQEQQMAQQGAPV